jgi:Cu/Zn superoxide dismutase
MSRLTDFEEECMTRRIAVAAVASIAAICIASVATAASSSSAKAYRASLAAVNPDATTAGLADAVGKAQLVDGKKNNKVSLHMRNLAADTVYLWHVHEGSCADTGAPVPGWTYRTQGGDNGTLTTNESGNANTRGKSATFNADPAKTWRPAPSLPAVTCRPPRRHTRRKPRARSRSTDPGPSEARLEGTAGPLAFRSGAADAAIGAAGMTRRP